MRHLQLSRVIRVVALAGLTSAQAQAPAPVPRQMPFDILVVS